MDSRRSKRYLFWMAQIVGLCVLILFLGNYVLSFYTGFSLLPKGADKLRKRYSELVVDKKNREIRFKAMINKRSGWVQTLIYFPPDKWLEKIPQLEKYKEDIPYVLSRSCAIKTGVDLTKLRDVILDLGIEYWKPHDIIIEYDGQKVSALELVKDMPEKVALEKLVFLGFGLETGRKFESFFGDLAFSFAEEWIKPPIDDVIKSWFLRQSGKSGFLLNSQVIPPEKTEVIIHIYF